MARYKVARMTVRQALAELQREGLAIARRGSGVFVSDPHPVVRDELRWLSRLPWERGEEVWRGSGDHPLRVEELEVAEAAAPGHIATALEIPVGESAWARSRRYLLDRREVMLSVSWLPADVAQAPGALDENPGPGGVYARLSAAGHAPVRFREDVRARLAAPHEAERLALAAGAAVLAVERVAYSRQRPVEVTELVLDAAAYVLRYDVPVEAKPRRRSGATR